MPARRGAFVPQRPCPSSPWHVEHVKYSARPRSTSPPDNVTGAALFGSVAMYASTFSRVAGSATSCDIGAICGPNWSPIAVPRTPRLIVQQLPADVPGIEPGELRRVELLLALALRAVARRADRIVGAGPRSRCRRVGLAFAQTSAGSRATPDMRPARLLRPCRASQSARCRRAPRRESRKCPARVGVNHW